MKAPDALAASEKNLAIDEDGVIIRRREGSEEVVDVVWSGGHSGVTLLAVHDGDDWQPLGVVDGAAAERITELESFVAREGYRLCDIPACNCGSYHGGHAMNRLREIDDELGDMDGTLLSRVVACKSRIVELEEQLSWQQEQASLVYDHITHNLSKPNYEASVVIAAADEKASDWVEECVKEAREEDAETIFELRKQLDALVDERNLAHSVIRHCWIHSGPRNCGANQMTTEQRQFFQEVTEWDEERPLPLPTAPLPSETTLQVPATPAAGLQSEGESCNAEPAVQGILKSDGPIKETGLKFENDPQPTDTTPRPECLAKGVRVQNDLNQQCGWAVRLDREEFRVFFDSGKDGRWLLDSHAFSVLSDDNNDPELAAAIEGEGA